MYTDTQVKSDHKADDIRKYFNNPEYVLKFTELMQNSIVSKNTRKDNKQNNCVGDY
jgi:hypothetical protein